MGAGVEQGRRARRAARRLRSGEATARGERGQATVEYALVLLVLLVGAGVGLQAFLPAALEAYDRYAAGFLLVLGLPIP